MAQILQHRRNTTTGLQNERGSIGEIIIDTTKNTVVVMDGATNGGTPLAKESDIPTDVSQLTDTEGLLGGGTANLEDIVVSNNSGRTKLALSNKDFTIETTRTGTQDADINLTAADDIFIEALGDDIELSANDEVRIYTNDYDKEWTFNSSGNIVLPVGGDILNSDGISVLAGPGDPNVWVQTFESANGAPDDVPALASSVEYDSDGNIIALFSHISEINNSSYYSVGKYTSSGTKMWSARFLSDFNTDGWGLAVDNISNSIYIAGKTTPQANGYSVSTLTKIDSLDGSLEWSKEYDFGYQSTSSVVDVASDGNPVMVGYASNGTDDYVATTKVNAANGSIDWTRSLNGQGDEEAYGMAVGPNGEVVAIGFMEQLGVSDGAATLYANTNLNWTGGSLGATSNGVTFSVSVANGTPTFSNVSDTIGGKSVDGVIATINGSIFGGVDGVDDMIVKVGTLATNEPDNRMLVVKYNSSGAIQWQKAILFDAGFDCSGADADIDSMGNIYVTGNYQYSFDGGTTSAISILKLDSSGVKQWSRRVVGNCDSFGVSIVVGPDDKLYLSGVTANPNNFPDSYVWVAAKYGFDGTVEWQRLIDNVTTWSFAGGMFFSEGSGSTIAVKQDYVALSGGFGDAGQMPYAAVVQISATGDLFSAGDWDIRSATFSGFLDNAASDITVVDANKTAANNANNVNTSTVSPITDGSNFLLGTLYNSGDTGNSIYNGQYSVSIDTDGVVTMSTSRGSLEFGALPEPGGPSHFHIMRAVGDSQDLYFGDDYNYVLQRGPDYGPVPGYGYGVEIGTNDNDEGDQHVWRFGTDGAMTFPTLTVPINDNANPSGTGQTLKFGDSAQQAIIFGPESTESAINAERVIIQGAAGYANTAGEGGDVYLWAGPGGDANGNGGDIKIRAGRGIGSGTGGYLNFQAGDSGTSDGGWINIESGETQTYGLGGYVLIRAMSGGEITLRTFPETGNSNDWLFTNAGGTIFPNNTLKTIDGVDAAGNSVGGSGIPLTITTGVGGDARTDGFTGWNAGNGGNLTIAAGNAGSDIGSTTWGAIGGDIELIAGNSSRPYVGGNVIIRSGDAVNGPGAITLNTGTNQWKFDATGRLVNIDGLTLTTGGQFNICTIQNAGSGYTSDDPLPSATTGGTGSGMTVNFGYGLSGQLTSVSVSNPGTGYTNGDVISVGGGTGTFVITRYNDQANQGNNNFVEPSWEFGTDGNITFPDASVQRTAYTGNYTTIAKTGADINGNDVLFEITAVDGSDAVTEVIVTNSPNPVWVANTSGLALGDIDFTVNFDESGNATVIVNSGGTGHSVGETFLLQPAAVGATAPTPTALDITKAVNKLTNGVYTLADGVEGQMMYLVRQTGTTYNTVTVIVANARIDGSTYTNIEHYPFSYNTSGIDIDTLIFTDGAWQANGGTWD